LTALDLLSGDAHAFKDKVWASRVHLHHTRPADLVGLLSLTDVDRLLTSVALRTPALRVVKDGSVLPAARFTRSATIAGAPLSGLVDTRMVLEHFDAGATVVLQGLHRYWPPLTDLVRDLELELGHPCQANAYLTPPGSQGFARHSDTHDVFVFQTHGHKQWQVLDGDAERQVLLEPGLVMYLPTGTPHSARSEQEASLHVTLGINRLTWREALRRVSDRILAEERYDEPLPAGYVDEPGRLAARMAEQLTAYSHRLQDNDSATITDELVAGFLRQRTPLLRGGLEDRVRLDELDDDTVLERRATASCVLREEGDRLVVLLGDRALRMPVRLLAPLGFVRDHHRFRVRDLAPWLDETSRLVVTRRLVREGLLRFAP
jgi:bifunctional lysine-specific demethylase and histidyl-hydroxylase NO66